MKTRKGLKLIVVVVLLLCGMSLTSTVLAQGTWLDPDWNYRCSVTVANTGSALTDYQVLVTLDGDFDFNHAASDGADIRITAGDETTLLPFWIETWDATGETASIWVRVDSLPAGVNTLYIYYGNPEADSASNGASTFIFFDDFENFNLSMNADNYLTTPTYDGSGQAVHPDVVYIPGGWNGYAYWMAMTPYPNNQDQYENPSILASIDGLTWVEPADINPLVDPPSGGHNSDPDMLLVDGTLMLYYVELTGEEPGTDYSNIRVLTSTNGTAWNGPTTVISIPLAFNDYVLSPAVLYENNTFYMWYVRGACAAQGSQMYLRTSTDGINWDDNESAQEVSLAHDGYVVWHSDIQWDGSKYAMLYAAYPSGSNCAYTNLYYAQSTDVVNWTANTTPVLTPAPSGWDNTDIYRSTFLANGDSLRIWYSAESNTEWHVGYTEGDLDDFFAAQMRFSWDTIQNDTSATTDHARSGSYGLRQVGSGAYPRATKEITGHISFSAWLYDDMSMTDPGYLYLAVLRVQDASYSSIGTGLFTYQSPTHYAYHTAGYSYATSELARTADWHKLTINVGTTTSYLLIDDIQIASLDVLDEANIEVISLEGFLEGVGYFDDAYVRQFVDSEPSVTGIGIEENGPTAITLATFTAQPDDGQIIVSWETASELDNVGFNLYRSDAVDGPYILLNPTLIPSQAPGSVLGAIYTWRDEDVFPGRMYFYYLEDLAVNGMRELHGPVSTMLSANPNAVHLQQSLQGLGITSVSVLGLFAVIGGVLFGWRKRRNS
jgi:hypothetical protein